MIGISNLQKDYRKNVNAPLAGEADTKSDEINDADFTLLDDYCVIVLQSLLSEPNGIQRAALDDKLPCRGNRHYSPLTIEKLRNEFFFCKKTELCTKKHRPKNAAPYGRYYLTEAGRQKAIHALAIKNRSL